MSLTTSHTTAGGIGVTVTRRAVDYATGCEPLVEALDTRRGCLFASQVDAPGRYARFDMGFIDPPLAVSGQGRSFRVEALSARGRALLPLVLPALEGHPHLADLAISAGAISGRVIDAAGPFPEEERTRQPTLFSLVRALIAHFASPEDPHLGLYGAFGYDLAHQFEPVPRRLPRAPDARDLLLYLPDRLIVVDHARRVATEHAYAFDTSAGPSDSLPADNAPAPFNPVTTAPPPACDHVPGAYPAIVERVRALCHSGDLFEAVPSQTFAAATAGPPSAIYRRLRALNPAPYAGFLNLGEGEFLVAASPEMYVRVTGRRVETCPISGTIARGRDALEDAAQIRALLNSAKDEAELTMCTDVDRNDKARVCEPGSVRLLARRQIEQYARLFHTVDHVEGRLRNGFDALDAFLAHCWAVTVTGAPKRAAIAFLEANESSARRWYGGAIGHLGFDGDMNTGLTLRTARLKDGVAEVRAGATVLYDSDPHAEDGECRLKASALLEAILSDRMPADPRPTAAAGPSARALLVDFEDSFLHNLADYLRQTGLSVATFRHDAAREAIARVRPDLVILSPGPGRPADFAMGDIIEAALAQGAAIFGVCLGLQGLVEYFGGALDVAKRPAHGVPSLVRLGPSRLLAGLPERFAVGRYHSLHAARVPEALEVIAATDDGVVMAVEHRRLPILAVQFHPESILTAEGEVGLSLVRQAASALLAGRAAARAPEPARMAASG
jgi:anthranilate synthase